MGRPRGSHSPSRFKQVPEPRVVCYDEFPHLAEQFRNLACCGKGLCGDCYARVEMTNGCFKCPNCRFEWDFDTREDVLRLRAQDGKAFAQNLLATHCYLNARDREESHPQGFSQAAYWCRKAAEQGHPGATFQLGMFHCHGVGGLPKSNSKAQRFLEFAAKHGDAQAQYFLAKFFFTGDAAVGGTKDYSKALPLSTLSASQGYAEGQKLLGCMFLTGKGVEKSLCRALNWFAKAAKQGCKDVLSYDKIPTALLEFAGQAFGYAHIPGHSPLPMMLNLARHAPENDENSKFMLNFKRSFKTRCAGCLDEETELTLACARCKAMWYCGKECQKSHWKAGHKRDCCDFNTLKSKSWYMSTFNLVGLPVVSQPIV